MKHFFKVKSSKPYWLFYIIEMGIPILIALLLTNYFYLLLSMGGLFLFIAGGGGLIVAAVVYLLSRYGRIYLHSHHDTLTGLPNKILFEFQTDLAIRFLRKSEKMYVLILDFDKFKQINNTFGRDVGNELLVTVSKNIRKIINDDIKMYRFGSTQFVLVIKESTDNVIDENVHLYTAQRILRLFDKPFDVNRFQVNVGVSIGSVEVTRENSETISMTEFFRRAEIAMYHAKNKQLGYVEFDSTMDDEVKHLDYKLASDLKHAVDNHELRVEYQLQLNVETGRLESVETLARWMHPTLGKVPPVRFIPLAEQTGIIDDIFVFTFKQMLKDMATLDAQGITLNASVNISPYNLNNHLLVSEVSEIIRYSNINPARLTFEITEAGLTGKMEDVVKFLTDISHLGVKLSIDDFGTGFSSLTYLRYLPLSEIKIDQSFVREMLINKKDFLIVDSTIKIAKSMGYTIVAEGVEEQVIFDELKKMGCTSIQGYLINKPCQLSELPTIINRFGS